MIRSLLISGDLGEARLWRVLREICDIAAASSADDDDRLVIVIDSEGAEVAPLLAFFEQVMGDEGTRRALERAEVKIYKAWSGAAFLAFSMGGRREMAAEEKIGFHLPLMRLHYWDCNSQGEITRKDVTEGNLKINSLLAELLTRHGLDEPELTHTLYYQTGYLSLTADECLRRGLVSDTLTDTTIRTILLSGNLNQRRLDRALAEIRRISERIETGDGGEPGLILMFDSTEGDAAAGLRFLNALLGDEATGRVVEGARIKIYAAAGIASTRQRASHLRGSGHRGISRFPAGPGA